MARILRPLLFAMTKQRWSGVEHLPRDRGFVVAANHVTMVDPVTTAHYLYDNGFAGRVLAKESLFRVPLFGAVLRSSGMVPVHRGTARAADSLRGAEAAVEAGECVVVFPEGTLTREPDMWPMAGKTGVARVALATRAPVVPVAQWGTHRLLARYGKLLKPVPRKPVTVVAGPPVDLSDLYDKPLDAATLREATDRVMDAITHLLEEIRGEQAPPERFVWRRGEDRS
ncbi:lysophospholipid acyltransferase family protein [Actinotalea fermentans]|uniref:1-acyl-sn-glycerol-3-phosphate acyltransferase n=1 Tax=Actinotalea fermentans TaxID=43671 RepID=A0A511YTF8_9CELL|nr:lysophospholipid acyltransferase family protein [Actinotalea fermentans]GEN78469.1 1-acyl-sn-glycerol-3-phosphate acyltransferase [Actinotalea fermentans]